MDDEVVQVDQRADAELVELPVGVQELFSRSGFVGGLQDEEHVGVVEVSGEVRDGGQLGEVSASVPVPEPAVRLVGHFDLLERELSEVRVVFGLVDLEDGLGERADLVCSALHDAERERGCVLAVDDLVYGRLGSKISERVNTFGAVDRVQRDESGLFHVAALHVFAVDLDSDDSLGAFCEESHAFVVLPDGHRVEETEQPSVLAGEGWTAGVDSFGLHGHTFGPSRRMRQVEELVLVSARRSEVGVEIHDVILQ